MSGRPVVVEWVSAQVEGRDAFRLMVVLAAPGCAWHRKSGGCTVCAFPSSQGTGKPVSLQDYEAQLDDALAHVPPDYAGPWQLDLFVSGSFFNPDEVPFDAQESLLRRAARQPRMRRVVVETRPEYATAEALERARAAVLASSTPPALEIGIGLESANAEIREGRINKGFTWEQFVEAARQVAAIGASLLTYVLLKPIGTSEAEALEDAVGSGERVFELCASLGLPVRIALEPCFVAPGTPLAKAFDEGRFHPPWLWSAVEVVRRLAPLGPVQVGLSDEGLNPARSAHNCARCTAGVRRALATFNASQRVKVFDGLDCACRESWRHEVQAKTG
ncbi:MAG: radical SAM protein [Myxococcales bacterium]|jgi:radical SAM enzyme (TIGR01210 family)